MEKVRRFGFGTVDLRAAENDSGAFVLFPAYDRAVARIEGLEAELATLRSENERLKVRAEVAERALENACNELSAWSTETISAIYEKHIADAERELRTQATQKGLAQQASISQDHREHPEG